MDINLPIKAGERPLFKALRLLQTMTRDFQRNENVYDTVTHEEIIVSACELFVLAEILVLRQHAGTRKNSSDLENIFSNLPLFFNLEQVQNWENKRAWEKFVETPAYKPYYENSINSQNPSLAYQVDTTVKTHIWNNWFENTPIDEMVSLCEDSAKRLLSWNASRQQRPALYSNLEFIMPSLGLPVEKCEDLTNLIILGGAHDKLWSLYLKERNTSPSTLVKIWENALGVKRNSLEEFFIHDSIWSSIFVPLSKEQDWENIWKNSYKLNMKRIDIKVVNAKNILSLFSKPFNETALPLEYFNHIELLEPVLKAAQNSSNLKVLMHGAVGVGKSSLVASMLKELGVMGIEPLKEEEEYQNKINQFKIVNNLAHRFQGLAVRSEERSVTEFRNIC